MKQKQINKQNAFSRGLLHFIMILIVLFNISQSLQILSRPTITKYNQYGQPSSFIISFKPYQDIYSNHIIQLQFPQSIHNNFNYISFSLASHQYYQQNTSINYQNNFQNYIIISQQSLTPIVSSKTTYYLPLTNIITYSTNAKGYKFITKLLWYHIQIFINKNPLTLQSGIISLQIITSQTNANHIIQLKDLALSYYYINATTTNPPTVNININIINPSQISHSPAKSYPIQLQIDSTLSSSTSTTLYIALTNTTYNGVTFNPVILTDYHFTFQGICQIICQSSTNCMQPSSCLIHPQIITLKLPYINANQPFVLSFWVKNPDFVSSINIQTYWRQENSYIGGIGILQNALTVNSIQLSSQQIRLLWGIPYSTVQSLGLGLFLGDTLNNVDIGFSINSVTPIGTFFTVKIYLGADGVLDSSINTNLPQKNSIKKVVCYYQAPYLICQNVGAFSKIGFRYYVRAKAQFTSSSIIGQFGDIEIKHERDASLSLIDTLIRGMTISTIANSDYRDYSGIHKGDYWLQETMIIGRKDTQLPNSSFIHLNNLFNSIDSNHSFIGIDSTVQQQQLIFFLKVDPIFMASPTQPTNQTYTMKVYFNPNAIKNSSNKGIDFGAFNSTSQNWQLQSTSCYFNTYPNATNQTYACQKYNDHVVDAQFDNTLTLNQFYNEYTWNCGKGYVTVCTDGDCESQCNIFKGYSSTGLSGMTQGQGGFFSIRNVTFASNYNSPTLANTQNLDFVIVFWHGSTLVSATLINAYTLKSSRLSYLNIQFVNKYNDGTLINDGSRIPTMLHLYGHFSLAQFPLSGVSQIQLFLPSTIELQDFTELSNVNPYKYSIGCSHSCYVFQSKNVVMAGFNDIDSWVLQKSINIKKLPILISDFHLLIPMKINGIVHSISMSTKDSNGNILSVYRFNGSAIEQKFIPSSLPKYNLAELFLPLIPWASLSTSPWVNNAGFSYYQGLDMTKVAKLSQFNVILMNNSILQDSGEGSTTFTVSYQSIFSTTSSININQIKQNCISPFRYKFIDTINILNTKDLYTIWCKTQSLALNTINITYPIYPNIFGTSFAYNKAMAYSFSNKNGYLSAYRQQDRDRLSTPLCLTQKITQYNIKASGLQSSTFSISFSPLIFSSETINSLQIQLQIPSFIPITAASVNSCSAEQRYSKINFVCLYNGIVTGSTHSFKVSYSTSQSKWQISILKIMLNIITSAANALSQITAIYTVNVYIPQTTSTAIQIYYGTLFTPFKSNVYTCTNTFTISNIPPQSQIIQILNTNYPIKDNTFSSNLLITNSLVNLQVQFKFASARSTIFDLSHITFNFTQPIFHSFFSSCNIYPNQYFWESFIIDSSLSSIQFKPKNTINNFTDIVYTLKCNNILPNCPLSANIYWLDSGTIAQQTTSAFIFNCSTILSSTTGSLSIIQKLYATEGYFGSYRFQFSGIALDGLNDIKMHLAFIERNIVGTLVQCWYLLGNGSYVPIFCGKQYSLDANKLLIQFLPQAGSSFELKIDGIHQQMFLNTNNLNIHALIQHNSLYYTFSVIDSQPGSILPTQLPIIINNITISKNTSLINSISTLNQYLLQIQFNFQTDYTDLVFFLEIDQLLSMKDYFQTIILCQINSIDYLCERMTKNLIKITIDFTILANINYLLQIGPLMRTQLPNQQIDGQFLHFKLFIADSSQNNIIKGSVTFLDNPIFKNSLYANQNIGNLYWNLTGGQVRKIYIGYYGPSVSLLSKYIDFNNNKTIVRSFVQQIELSPNFINSINIYLMKYTIANLGQQKLDTFIAVDPNILSTLAVGTLPSINLQNLYFTHSSLLYYQIESLPIMLVKQKCSIFSQYSKYSIYPDGVTIPIKLNFTNCRPLTNLTLTYSTNASYISANDSLSNFIVDFQHPIAFIVMRHDTNVVGSTIGRTVILTVSMAGNQVSFYENIPSITIQIKDPVIVGNPQPKQPIINQLTSNMIDVQLQCNQPSTIYWAISLYPSILGVVPRQIQSHLLKQKRGLVLQFGEQFSWTYDRYGFTYVFQSNIETNLTIDGLFGNQYYIFKYFCVNLLGNSSGGKILYFTTINSNNSLTKIIIDYNPISQNDKTNIIELNYYQNNLLACAIAQLLVIPYSQVITSTFSNCKNNPQVIHQNQTYFIDQYLPFNYKRYLFYIRTQKKTIQQIQYLLMYQLKKKQIFIFQQVPLFSSLKIQQLSYSSAKQPQLNGIWHSATPYSLKIVLNVGIQNSYAVGAITNIVFNNLSLSIPLHYQIKQGFFSNNTKFDSVLMIYGRNNISLQFIGLNPNSNYSVFFFSTVDNSALNSHSSQVKYLSITTPSVLRIDLYSINNKKWLGILILILIILIK